MLDDVWRWNYGRAELKDMVGDHYYVTNVAFARVGDHAESVGGIVQARGVLLPRVDRILLVGHGDDRRVVSWHEVATALELDEADLEPSEPPYWSVVRSEIDRIDEMFPHGGGAVTFEDIELGNVAPRELVDSLR
jgi:hypothetical protein